MSSLVHDFFNPDKEMPLIKRRALPCGGAVDSSLFSSFRDERSVGDYDEYDFVSERVRDYQIEEEEVYRKKYLDASNTSALNLDTISADGLTKNYTELYSNYKKSDRIERDGLLIDHYQQKILNTTETSGVLVIQGPTGCGKSTQVPQFILNDCMYKGKPCNIVVTQPRRIAAVSLAQRVAHERQWPIGSIVGFKVSLEQNVNEDTRLLYCTTGVLLRKLISTKTISEYTHIILDEVHERDQEMDFLLLTVRKLRANSPNTKVILMSATIDAAKFSNYFKILDGNKMVPCPVIEIDKDQNYRTDTFYLNHMTALTSNFGPLQFDYDTPKFERTLVKICARLICIFDKLDENVKGHQVVASVLVFVPGMHEIDELYKELKECSARDRKTALTEWKILPLHSSITIEEQKKIFDHVEKNVRKIILSTNIAESSLTVPKVGYVIDFCLTKCLIYNQESKFTSLQLNWASISSLDQRAGRTGRVCNGRVYRLISEDLANSLNEMTTPEMLRCPLDRLVLMSKMLDMGKPFQILSLALDPPEMKNVRKTILLLKEAGALITKKFAEIEDDGLDADITFLGKVMADLPLDICCTKLIVLGFIFNLLEEAIVIASAISIKSVFSVPFDSRLQSYMWKLSWADGSCSDLIAFYNVYRYYRYMESTRQNQVRPTDYSWARRMFLQKSVLREWMTLVEELKKRLVRHNLMKPEAFMNTEVLDKERMILLKAIIAGAFYPNYFYRQGHPSLEKDAVRALNNCDPFTSVFLTGMDQDQPKHLYSKSIKRLFHDCADEMDISYDMSKKVFVQFRKSSEVKTINLGNLTFQAYVPGKVANEVYRAVRMRQLKIPFEINVMNSVEANKRMKLIMASSSDLYKTTTIDGFSKKSFLPQVGTREIRIRIAHIIDAGNFFAHYCNPEIVKLLQHLFSMLNNKQLPLMPLTEVVKVNGLYAALFKEDGHCGYYRARVIMFESGSASVEPIALESTSKVRVQFIDYGNKSIVNVRDMMTLPIEATNYEPIAIECRLAMIKPSKLINDNNAWTPTATKSFHDATNNIDLVGVVYSVVNRVVNLTLYRDATKSLSLNQHLVDNKFAVACEEDYLSKQSHAEWERHSNNPNSLATLYQSNYDNMNVDEIEPPTDAECIKRIYFKGPFSPLEMKLFSFMEGVQEVTVDQNSVNAVLIDTEPSDVFDRLYVASSISENRSGSNLNLRYLTAMPSVPGFMAMMAMIFCPTMSVKKSQNNIRIGNIVCGLGHDKYYRSYLPEHDIVMNLDVFFDMDDLLCVNSIRYYMSRVLHSLDNAEADNDLLSQSRSMIKSNFLTLLKRPRDHYLKEQLPSEFKWKKRPDDLILKALVDDQSSANYVWPVHAGVKLDSMSPGVKYTDNVEMLKKIARGEIEEVKFPVKCISCDENLYDGVHIRHHIVQMYHNENLKHKSGGC